MKKIKWKIRNQFGEEQEYVMKPSDLKLLRDYVAKKDKLNPQPKPTPKDDRLFDRAVAGVEIFVLVCMIIIASYLLWMWIKK